MAHRKKGDLCKLHDRIQVINNKLNEDLHTFNFLIAAFDFSSSLLVIVLFIYSYS